MPHGLAKKKFLNLKKYILDFSGGSVVRNLTAKAGDTGSIPNLGGTHMPQIN